ncbi:MAG: hypothetical protein LBH49_01710 [Puniceicoccales bacterium]|jgi:hypothetical protein|nr:hypothetical protein [Puniceicoccales bacterium]
MWKIILVIGFAFIFGLDDSMATKFNNYSIGSETHINSGQNLSYAGTLKKSKKFLFGLLGLFKSKTPYELVGSNGTRVLYVEPSDSVQAGDLFRFINRKVVISGEVRHEDRNSILKAERISLD